MSVRINYNIRDGVIRTFTLPMTEKDAKEWDDLKYQLHSLINFSAINTERKKDLLDTAKLFGIKRISNKNLNQLREYLYPIFQSITSRLAIFMRQHYQDEGISSLLISWYYVYLKRNGITAAIDYWTNKLLIKDDVIANGGIW
jgi:hypothetical protein